MFVNGSGWRRLKCEKLTDDRRRTPSDGKKCLNFHGYQGKDSHFENLKP